MPLNCTLKVVNVVYLILCIFYHNKKKIKKVSGPLLWAPKLFLSNKLHAFKVQNDVQ